MGRSNKQYAPLSTTNCTYLLEPHRFLGRNTVNVASSYSGGLHGDRCLRFLCWPEYRGLLPHLLLHAGDEATNARGTRLRFRCDHSPPRPVPSYRAVPVVVQEVHHVPKRRTRATTVPLRGDRGQSLPGINWRFREREGVSANETP